MGNTEHGTQHASLFGRWLRERRRTLGITQEDLAERLSCSASLVRKLEAGQRVASAEMAEQLAELCAVPVAERAAFVQFTTGRLSGEAAQRKLRLTLSTHTARPHPTNLTAPLTTLLGREQELERLGDHLLSNSARLVTVTGPPGIGKTRLAVEAGIRLLDHFEDGVFFVSLASVKDPDLVPAAIALVLRVEDARGVPRLEQVGRYLQDKQLLLLLDNFEQVLDASPLVLKLLGACSRLKVLVTSREALHVHGEQQFPVPSLTTPDPEMLLPSQAMERIPAIALFTERARSVRPAFALTDDNARSVAAICSHLDGLPLAIELAAARMKLFSPQEIHARLESRDVGQNLAMLSSRVRNLPPRQRTLRDAIEWSYLLLDPGERRLFARLSVFVGGCTLPAADVVCNAGGDLPFDTLEGLASLIDKSLLKREEVLGESRYMMLEMIREYAAERLTGSGEAEEIERRHAEYYLALAEATEAQLNGPEQRRLVLQLEAEHADFRASLRWAREKGKGTGPEAQEAVDIGLRIGAAIRYFWFLRSSYGQGREELQRLLSLSPQATLSTYSKGARAKALAAVGRMAYRQGDYPMACSLLEESLVLRREIGDRAAIAWSLSYLAMAQLQKMMVSGQVDHTPARLLQEEGLALHREVRDKWGIAISLEQLGIMAYLAGDYPGASMLFEESLALHKEVGQRSSIGILTYELGMVAYLAGDYPRAYPLAEESLGIQRELGYKMGIALSLAGLGEVKVETGQPEIGTRLLGASEGLYEAIGGVMEACDRIAYKLAMTSACSQLGEAAFHKAWQEGRAMSVEQALEYAFHK